jgi:hypothetical protein
MRIVKLTFYKEMKIGLPQFSNVTIGHGMDVEVKDGENVDYDSCWDEVNRQLSIQTQGVDPSWVQTGNYKNFFKTTIRTPKNGGESNNG